MILFQVTIGLNAAQTDTGAIQALVGGIVGGQANVTAGANTLSFTLAWDETLDGDFPSSLSFQFTGSGGNSLTFTSISINGQSVDLGTYLDNATINSGTQNGTITIGAPIRHFFGRQEPDVGNPVDIRNNPADALNTDLARPGDTTANVTIVPNVPQTAAIEGSSGRDIIYGSDFADRVNAGDGDDSVAGNNGGDTLYGGAGNDMIAGGAGDDTIFGGTGDDLIFGNAGADLIQGQGGNNVLNGGDGADTLVGGANNDILFGGADDDLISGGNGNDAMHGDDGDDLLSGGNGHDTGWGGAGNDTLAGGNGNDTLFGEADDDMLSGGAGADSLDGGAGADIMMGGDGADLIYGGLGNDVLLGEAGNDTLQGQDGDDVLIGGAGTDTLDGGAGADIIYGTSIDTATATTLVAQGGRPDVSFGMAGNSFYKVVLGSYTYAQALAAAAADTLNGVAGHLVVITSAAEQATVNELVAAAGGTGQFWMGASDTNPLVGEGGWIWEAGPENTQQFSNNSGTAYNGFLSYWQGGAPANSSGLEDYAALNADNNGYWTANASTATFGYIIEWDASGMSADTGADVLTGGDGNDALYAGAGGTTFDGGSGNDRMYGGAGNDVFKGGAGLDYILAGGGVNTYDASTATESIVTQNFFGANIMMGVADGYGASNEILMGISNVIGGAFNDTLESLGGNNVLSGGGGTDLLTYANASAGVTVNLGVTTAQATGGSGSDTVSGFENLTGSAHADTLTGNSGANAIDGGAGDDTLVGGAGNDVITGGGGTDTVDYTNDPGAVTINLGFFGSSATDGWGGTDSFGYSIANAIGSSFNDSIIGTSTNNVLLGGAGDDTFFTLQGTDSVDGGTGNDTISYFVGPGAVTIDLGAGTVSASGHSAGLTSIENAVGSAGNDTIAGSSGSNVLNGLGGTDLLTYATATAAVTVNLATTTAQNTGGAGTDTVLGFENLTGSAFNDTLTGDSGANAITGGDGNDTITGGTGADTLDGGAGNDVFNVANGDFVSGDSITGGSGTADTIVLTTTGATADFSLGTLASVETITATSGNDIVTVLATQYAGVLARIDLGSAGSDTYRVFVNGPMDISAATAATVSGSGTITGNLWGSGNDDSITLSGGQLDAILVGVLPSIAMGAGTDIINLTSNSSRLNVVATIGSGWGNALITGIETISASAATAAVTLNMSLQSEGMTLIGGSGHDVITGGSANDFIDGGNGNDVLTGGAGTDTVTYANATASVTLSLATTTAQNTGGAGTDTVTGFENLTGSAFNDILTGTTAANFIDGGNGNDTFNIANGDFVSGDSITGGAGTADTIVLTTVGATADFSLGTLATVETITGTTGNDAVTILATHYAGMLSAIDLGAGSADTLSVKVSGTMDISAATAATISGVEFGYLVGTTGDDSLTITGAQLNAIMLSLVASIALGNGTDTLNLTSTSTRLNDLGVAADSLVSGVEAISGASAAAGVTVSLTAQTEGFTLTGSGFADTIAGGAGADTIIGGAGNDTLTGGDGNDIFVDGAGADELHGGNGTDTADYGSAAAGVFVHLNWFGGQVAVDESLVTLTSIENVIGSSMSDTLFGSSGANVIDGGAGNDSIEGGNGNDVLIGGTGTDTLGYSVGSTAGVTVNLATTTAQNTGAAGTDTVSGFENLTGSNYNDRLTGDSGANTINGGNGDDTIDGGLGNDVLFGAAGVDTLVYTGTTAGIIINLATTTAQSTGGSGTQTVSGFENVVGTALNDTLTGTTGDNTIDGGLGNDILTADTGTDTVVYTHATAGITINLATTTAQNTGGSGTDTISGFENIVGSAYNDTLTGTTGDNIIDAGVGGNDVLTGGTGNDTLSYALSTAGVTVNITTTTAQNTGGNGTDTITGFESVIGSAFNDVLTSNSADTLATQVSTILAANSGVSYDATTGNFYKFINSTATWTAANTAATSAQLTGVSGVYGHIAMPYSSYENNLLDTFTGLGTNQIWLGATDGVTEGTWLIAGGAMDGVALWIGTSGGAVQNSLWTNWNPGQPDNASNADHIGQNDGGLWEDRDPTNNRRYIIEWDGSQVLNPTSSATLHGGAGTDSLYGSGGQDVFMFMGGDNAIGTEANADKIYNFSHVQHDTINIADILTGYGGGDPDAFAKFEVSGSNVVLKVDASGGSSFGSSTVAAVFVGTTDLTLFNVEHMVRDGFLVMG